MANISSAAEANEQNFPTYHTIAICKHLPPTNKEYPQHDPKDRPDEEYWIKDVDKNGDKTRYKVQHVVANGPHTSSEGKHAIFQAFLYAYNTHEDIVLNPDDIWLMICIYFATYVNQNSEQLRTLFVDHEGTKLLTIVQVGLIEPDWKDFLDRMRIQIGQVVKNDIVNSLTANFSTTGLIESLLSCAATMDTFKNYFEYRCFITRCGIRNVHFMGTLEDWNLLYQKTENLKKFTKGGNDTFATYIDGVLPILQKFIDTYNNIVDNQFWNKVMDIEHVGGGGSGRMPGEYISGWFLKLCYGFHERRNINTKEIILRSLVVPVQVDNEITNISKTCYVAGGFHGVESRDGHHKPVMSIAIMDDTTSIKPYEKK